MESVILQSPDSDFLPALYESLCFQGLNAPADLMLYEYAALGIPPGFLLRCHRETILDERVQRLEVHGAVLFEDFALCFLNLASVREHFLFSPLVISEAVCCRNLFVAGIRCGNAWGHRMSFRLAIFLIWNYAGKTSLWVCYI